MDNTFTYKGHNIQIEETQEYSWLPIRYCFSINGQYEFKLTVKCSNRKLLKFQSKRQAEWAAKRLIDAGTTQ